MSVPPVIVGIDQGTTERPCWRSTAFASRVAAIAISLELPPPGQVQHHPEAYGSRRRRPLPRRAPSQGSVQIAAIGITTSVKRPRCGSVRRAGGLRPRCRGTGAPPRSTDCAPKVWNPSCASGPASCSTRTCSASKIAWLLDYTPEPRRGPRPAKFAFGTVDSFLLRRLSVAGSM